MLLILPFAAWLCAAPATAAVSCAKWNAQAFFERANATDVSRCLRAGANVNARGAATYSKTPAVVNALLKAGANVNARDKYGLTPLHRAAVLSETPAVVDALLKAGADAAARDRAGKTPFDYAKENSALKGTDAYWRLNEARFK